MNTIVLYFTPTLTQTQHLEVREIVQESANHLVLKFVVAEEQSEDALAVLAQDLNPFLLDFVVTEVQLYELGQVGGHGNQSSIGYPCVPQSQSHQLRELFGEVYQPIILYPVFI